jgi:hypothetical protein
MLALGGQDDLVKAGAILLNATPLFIQRLTQAGIKRFTVNTAEALSTAFRLLEKATECISDIMNQLRCVSGFMGKVRMGFDTEYIIRQLG